MNPLEQFLNVPNSGPADFQSLGTETDWLAFKNLLLTEGELLISDYAFLPDREEGLVVKLPAGEYSVFAKVLDYSGDRRISRVRVVLPGLSPAVGEKIGETWTDTACSAMADAVALDSAWKLLGEKEAEGRLAKAADGFVPCGICAILPEKPWPICFFSSGFGDGTYPVLELLDGKRRVGVEVVFIGTQDPYPFGEQETPPSASEPAQPKDPDPLQGLMDLVKKAVKAKAGDPVASKAAIREVLSQELGSMRKHAEAAMEELRVLRTQKRRQPGPMSIRYLPLATPPSAPPDLWAVSETLVGLGFAAIGVFEIEGIKNFRAWGFLHPRDQIAAQLIPTPQGNPLELASLLAGDREFRMTNTASAPGLTVPPWLTVENHPGATPEMLMELFLRARPADPLPLTAEDFPTLQARTFNRTQQWRAERGGWTLEEIRVQRKLPAEAPISENLWMERQLSAELWFWRWLQLQPSLPFELDAVIEKLSIVHDDIPPELVLNTWQLATFDLGTKASAFQDRGAREAFAAVNEAAGSPLRRVLQKTTPLEADFYLPADLVS